jgi:serine phosphatase RsbU (regulator of sigma subunit)
MPYLVVANGPDMGSRHEVSETQTLGRHPDCDIVIEVGAVSRQHARVIERDDGSFEVQDLGSRNGTYVNGELISEPVILNDGDRVRICDVELTYFSTPPAHTIDEVSDDASSALNVLLDDSRSGATIMSKLDVSTRGAVQLTASPEAKLEAILEINRSLASALSLDDVLPEVLNSLFRIFVQADRGFIVLAEGEELIPRWRKTRRDDGDAIRTSRTVVNQVMTTKEAILSADAATDERFEMSQSVADFRIRSMMCAPLLDLEGNPLGVLQIDTLDQRKRFDADDLAVLASVAAQAGIAIRNARLHEAAIEQQAVQRDIKLARDVQMSFLPHDEPEIDGYDFYHYYLPAHHVGGDYFDYLKLPDGRLVIIVADVVGHGIAAAMLMAKFAAEFRFSIASGGTPAEAISILNDRMSGLELDRFVTMILVILEPNSNTMTIVNAGHMAPFCRRRDGQVEDLAESCRGLPIGIMDGYPYEQAEVTLGAGDRILLYTDGVNETMDPDGECYGIERMKEWFDNLTGDVKVDAERLIEDVGKFRDTEPQFDDMCLVYFSVNETETESEQNPGT